MGKVVDVTLRLIDKMTGPLKGAEAVLKNHSKQFITAGKQIQAAGKKITGAGVSMTKGVTVPVAAAGGAAIKLAADFEAGMSKVSSISGATGKDLDKLSKMAKKMGAKTKFSAKEATDAYQYMAMAGWKTGDMLNGIEPIMKLAGASGEDLATTSDIVTDALTAFGMKTKDTGKLTDIMAAASANANTNVAMLGESFKYCAPVAGAMGYNAKDVSVSLGLMANSGIKASQAGTAMRSWMSRLAKPTKEVDTAMSKLGLSITDSNGKMKPWNQIMKESRKAFSGLTAEQKASYAASIAGETGMSGMLAVVNASDKDFKKLTKAVNGSNGACKKMYDVANDNLNGSLTILKSTVEGIGISFGERLTPYVKKATKWVQNIADKFNSLNKSQQDTIIKVALVAAAVGPALLVFGKTVSTVGKVVGAIGSLGRMINSFGSIMGILTSPSGIVIGVLAAIAVGAVLVYKNWDKIRPVFNKVAIQIKKMVEVAKPAIDSMLKAVSKAMPKIRSMSVGAINAIIPFVKSAIQLVRKIASVISKVLHNAIKATIPVVKKAGEAFGAVFPVIVSVVGGAVGKVVAFIKKLQPVFSIACSVVGSVISSFGNTFSDVFSGITKVCGGVLDFISGTFTGNWKKAWTGVKSIFSGIFSTFGAIARAPINAVISAVNGAIEGFNKIKIPDWVPGVGGKGINIPTIPQLAKGTNNWQGGIVQISERGGEIVDLPRGSRVYPHDKSVKKAYNDGRKSTGGSKKVIINIPKLADNIIIREDADIDRFTTKLADKLEKVSNNVGDDIDEGGDDLGYIY